MLASLPMYDRPELAAAHDRLWGLVRARLPEAPECLTRTGDVWHHWTAPDLLLSQTCSAPFRAKLHGQVSLVGTPVWDLDCPDGAYYSVIVAHPERPERDILAVNDGLSQSGWVAAQGLDFESVLVTGAHAASAKAVWTGAAHLAAIDAISWAHLRRYTDWAPDLQVLAKTKLTPALPYITAQDPEPVRDALAHAIAALPAADRKRLLLRGLIDIPEDTYLALPPIPDLPKR